MARLHENRLGSAERPVTSPVEQTRWYAIQTRARHEKRIGSELEQRGIRAFVPTLRQVHSWSDRKKTVEVPLFSCYVFVNLLASSEERLEVLKTSGVFQFVRVNGSPAPIPDSQIEGIQTVLANNLPVTTSGFVRIGQRVRIRGGSLDGVEGILSARKGAHALVISVDLIQQSVEVTVDGYAIETV